MNRVSYFWRNALRIAKSRKKRTRIYKFIPKIKKFSVKIKFWRKLTRFRRKVHSWGFIIICYNRAKIFKKMTKSWLQRMCENLKWEENLKSGSKNQAFLALKNQGFKNTNSSSLLEENSGNVDQKVSNRLDFHRSWKNIKQELAFSGKKPKKGKKKCKEKKFKNRARAKSEEGCLKILEQWSRKIEIVWNQNPSNVSKPPPKKENKI